ncbi:hypothetical protein [Streptomyces sp. AMCC400023]|uniref:hypothetical protein n=1 Tax=Streptomyces sp. AMCC400023 TaxID=2056258 RepID=UPI001F488929|nr:hypothetical protein [Streptomyces sp. AMCC400023]
MGKRRKNGPLGPGSGTPPSCAVAPGQDKALFARDELANRLIRELADWRTWEAYRERYLWDEYNDGITDPDPCELRLVDLVVPTPLEHPFVAALLQELGEYAAEYATGEQAAVKAVAVYDSWAPQQPKRVVRIHGGWWSLITRYPRAGLNEVGPAVVLMDGIIDAHDISPAPALPGYLETIMAAAPDQGRPVPDEPDAWFT